MKYVPQGNLRIYVGVIWFFASVVLLMLLLVVLEDPESLWVMAAYVSALLSYAFTTFVCCEYDG